MAYFKDIKDVKNSKYSVKIIEEQNRYYYVEFIIPDVFIIYNSQKYDFGDIPLCLKFSKTDIDDWIIYSDVRHPHCENTLCMGGEEDRISRYLKNKILMPILMSVEGVLRTYSSSSAYFNIKYSHANICCSICSKFSNIEVFMGRYNICEECYYEEDIFDKAHLIERCYKCGHKYTHNNILLVKDAPTSEFNNKYFCFACKSSLKRFKKSVRQ